MTKLKSLLTCVALAGCLEGPSEPDMTEEAQAAFVQIGNISQNGTLAVFETITNVGGGIDVAKIVGLAACDPKALYAVEQRIVQLVPTYKLWFSKNSGQTWADTGAYAKSKEIACDHAQLVTLDAAKRLWVASLRMNGNVDPWVQAPTTITVDRIQGGDGTFYGVKQTATGNQVFTASNRAIGANLQWAGPIATVGAVQITGTGTTTTGSDGQPVVSTLAWPWRAFALEANGTFSTNNSLLAGGNGWTAFSTGSERYLTLTAAAPNLLFAIQDRAGVREIDRIRIEESACFDGVDNDANGLSDKEDSSCRQAAANAFCAAQANGTYCSARYEPTVFLGQTNQNTALVTCTGGAATSLVAGACRPVAPGSDYLPSYEALVAPKPANTGHYCNIHWPDGSWDFDWSGTTPCETIRAKRPNENGTVVRAGLYSTNEANQVFVRCDNGGYGPAGAIGAAPLAAASAAVGHTTNRCIFQVSASALPVFDRMFESAHEIAYPARTASPFTRAVTPVSFAQFGNGQSGVGYVDRFGSAWPNASASTSREYAYDNPLDEGRPVYAPADGVILANGSRDRDVSGFGNPGTPSQGEIYLKVGIGADATYRETFVVYYAHLRKRLVASGQTVRRGQILGYVGASGATGGYAHLHTGVFRGSNVNAHTTANPQLGYHVDLLANGDTTGNSMGNWTSIDPLGWGNFVAFDPWAYADWNTAVGAPQSFTGIGGWSVNLFKPGQAFRYP